MAKDANDIYNRGIPMFCQKGWAEGALPSMPSLPGDPNLSLHSFNSKAENLDAQRWEAALGAALTNAFFPKSEEKGSFHESLDSKRWEGWSAVRPPPRCVCVCVCVCECVCVCVCVYAYVVS